MRPKKSNIARRSFLKKSAAATFGFTVLPSYLALGKADSSGKLPPSQRVNLACIGVGGRAKGVIPSLCKGGFAQPVAFCDVDFKNRRMTDLPEQYPDVARFADFRVMFDQMGDDIDAVSVVTPDHVHYVQALEAMQRGKHVYVEKPLTHTFVESENLMRAEAKYKVVTQMGNQGHTSGGATQFQQLVEAGAIRDIVKVDAFKNPAIWFMKEDARISKFPAGEQIPQSLDYDLWCGPAKQMPYSRKYHPFDWRGFYLYGNGMLGDWGAHIIDFAHDYLKLGLPTKVEALELTDHNQVIFPFTSRIGMHFPERGAGLPACDLIWSDGDDKAPTLDEKYWDTDSKGVLKAPALGDAGSVLYRKDEEFIIQRGTHAGVSRLYPKIKMQEYRSSMKPPRLPHNHQQSFIQACMGNGQTSSPFSVGGELTQVLLLGVIAQYLNQSFSFDPKTKRVTDNELAQALLAGPAPRKGWESYYNEI